MIQFGLIQTIYTILNGLDYQESLNPTISVLSQDQQRVRKGLIESGYGYENGYYDLHSNQSI